MPRVIKTNAGASAPDIQAIVANAVATALAQAQTVPAKPKAEPAEEFASAEVGVKIAQDGKEYHGVWFCNAAGKRVMFVGDRKLRAVVKYHDTCVKAIA